MMVRPPFAKPRARASTLRMNTGVRQIREKVRNRAILIGMSIPVHIVVRRSKSMAPLRAAASSAGREGAVPRDEVLFIVPVVGMEGKFGRTSKACHIPNRLFIQSAVVATARRACSEISQRH